MRRLWMTTLAVSVLTASTAFALPHKTYPFHLKSGAVASKSATKRLDGFGDLSELLHNKYVFALRDPKTGLVTYSTSGTFMLDEGGYIVSSSDKRLQGYVDSKDLLTNACQLSDIKLTESLPPQATNKFMMQLNLDATSTMPTKAFNPTDVNTYTSLIMSVLYDSLGKKYDANFYFVKTANNDWSLYVMIDNSMITKGRIIFDSNGALNKTEGLSTIVFTPNNGAIQQVISLSLDGTTQYASPLSDRISNQDGHGVLELTGLDVDDIGYVTEIYGDWSNGWSTEHAGKIAVLQQ